MKLSQTVLLFALLFLSFSLSAQNDYSIQLKSGAVHPSPNIKKAVVDSFNSRSMRFQQKTFAILQFEALPTEATKKMLLSNGIELLEYIPNSAYTVTITGSPSSAVLEQAKTRFIFEPSPEQKMEPRLAAGIFPSSATKIAGTIDVWVSFPKSYLATDVISNIRQLNIDVLSTEYQSFRLVSLRVASNRLRELAALPFIEYVQAAPGEDQPLNYNSRIGSRANVLNATIANGGKGLNGEGVTVGIGDNADVQTHVDFNGRLINRAAQALTSAHGYHTTGTLAGAGNVNEYWRGYAPKATIVSQSFNGIILNAPAYVTDYGMVVTNNSYGDNIDCGYMGTYDLYSRLLDQMAFDLPSLTNVFAAGNSGTGTCGNFLPGYHTVLGGYQSSKNVVVVGATDDVGNIASFSSRGPVRDGRIKPDITAMGKSVGSC
ncbi:MAG: S8 family serine peptidase, partial [Flavisolibacter sp.]